MQEAPIHHPEPLHTVGVYDVAAISFPPPGHVREDRVIHDSFRGFIGIFDGMSENWPADVASDIAANQFAELLARFPINSISEAQFMMKRAAENTQTVFRSHVGANLSDREMGTTALVGQVITDQNGLPSEFVVGNAGRSRIYLLHEDGSIARITRDHNLKENPASVDYEIERDDSEEGDEEDILFMRKLGEMVSTVRLTRFFDTDDCSLEIATFSLENVVAIIATSDAVHDYYTDERFMQTVQGAKNALDIAESLIQGTQVEDVYPYAFDDKSVVVLVINPEALHKTA